MLPDILTPVVFELPRLHSLAIDLGSAPCLADCEPTDPLPTLPLGHLEELDLQVVHL